MSFRAIGIRVVLSGKGFSTTEVEKLGRLTRKLMAKYDIGASGAMRHDNVTGKLRPAPYVTASKRATLKTAITGRDASGKTAPQHTAAPSQNSHTVIHGGYDKRDESKCRLESLYDAVQVRERDSVVTREGAIWGLPRL